MKGALRLRVATSLAGLSPAAWNACAEGRVIESTAETLESTSQLPESAPQDIVVNPFVSHAFLSSLEEAGCVGEGTGWSPAHILIEDGAGALVAAAPAYLKSHSRGEYVFDHAWAEAYGRAGGRYYPKLQLAAPFTPVAGPRLMVRGGPDADARRRALIAGVEALRRESGASSAHVTFAVEPDVAALESAGWLARHDIQFHWRNEG
jgi:predicted N-acyltransferase